MEHFVNEHSDNERKPTDTTSWTTLYQMSERDLVNAPSNRQGSTL